MWNFQKAIAFNPRHIEARRNLADILKGENKFQEALALQKEILSLDPTDLKAMSSLIEVTLKFDKGQALGLAKEYLQKTNNVSFLLNTGALLALDGHWKMALAFYSKSFNLDPQDKVVLLEFGKFFANYGKYDKAREL